MSRDRTPQSGLLLGLIIVAVGVVFLLGSLGHINSRQVFHDWWPLLLIVLGLWQLASGGFRNAFPGLILMAVGGVLLADRLLDLPRSVWSYAWPAFIIIVGLWILSGVFQRRPSGSSQGVAADDLNASVVLSGMNRVITSQSFRGGKASAMLGGLDIDLRQAALDKGQAVLDVNAILGGIDIKVPRNWRVVLETTPVLGGIESKVAPVPDAEVKGTLVIRGTAILGGVDIKN